ncbi:hypothetical protein FQR65_LT11518 [Abscondita terminalis]|nr:hypothetical protein FQR65_LT11518 [Abscondita terminalis]
MPRAKIIKTYSKRSNFHRRNSFEVLNALLAANLQKRQTSTKELKQPKRTKPIKLKELPPPDENHHLISDSFVGFNDFDNTFDELLKSTELDSVLKKKKISKTNLSFSTPNISHSDNNINEKPQRTLDKSIVDSLIIEKVPFSERKYKDFTTLSSILQESNFSKLQCYEDKQTIELSFIPIFSTKFQGINKKPIFSSTPAVLTGSRFAHTSIINDLSPISSKGQTKSLIEKSYDEINTWNFKPPKEFECHTSIISKQKGSVNKVTKAKLKSSRKNKNANENQLKIIGNFTKKYIDQKLNLEPRVSLNTSIDILGISYSVKLGPSIEHSKSGNGSNLAEIRNKAKGYRKSVVSQSTPAVLTGSRFAHTSIINDLSPISSKGQTKSLIEKSYDEINTWNFKPPKEFECHTSIISKQKGSVNKVTKAKLKSSRKNKNANENQLKIIGNFTKKYIDQKLNLEPRVSLNTSIDILGISYSVKLGPSIEHSKSGNGSNLAEIRNKAKGYRKSVVSQSTPVRYLNLRTRAVQITSSKSSKCKKNVMLHDTATNNGSIVTSVEQPSIGIKTGSILTSTNIIETEQVNETNEGIKLREDESIGFDSIFTSTKNFERSPTRDTSLQDEDKKDLKSRTPSDNVLEISELDKSEPLLYLKKLYIEDDEEGITSSLNNIKSLCNYSNNRWTVNLPSELTHTKECENTTSSLEFPKKNYVRRLYSLNEANNFKNFITKHDLLRDCSTPIIAKKRIAPSVDVNRTPQDKNADVVCHKLPSLGDLLCSSLLQEPENAETTINDQNIFNNASDLMDKNSLLNISDESSVPENEISIGFNEELLHKQMETSTDLFSESDEISQYINKPCNKLNVTELNMSCQETSSNRDSEIQTIHDEQLSTDQTGYQTPAELNVSCQETPNRESIIQAVTQHDEEVTTDQTRYETPTVKQINTILNEYSEMNVTQLNESFGEGSFDKLNVSELNINFEDTSFNRKSTNHAVVHRNDELFTDTSGCETLLNEFNNMNVTQLNISFEERLRNDESNEVFPVQDCGTLSKYRNISLSNIYTNDDSAIDEDELRKDHTPSIENVSGWNRSQYEHSYCCKECDNCLNKSCSSSKSNPLSDVIVISDEEDVPSNSGYICKRSNPENSTKRSFIIEVSSSDDELGNTNYSKDAGSISFDRTNCDTANISGNSLCNKLPALNIETNVSVNESNVDKEIQAGNLTTITPLIKKPLVLKTGKSWRRSLLQIRRNSIAYSRTLNTINQTEVKPFLLPHCFVSVFNQTFIKNTFMYYTVQEELLCKLKCLSLNKSLQTAYGPNSTNDTIYQERDIGETVNDLTRNISLYEPFERAKSIVLRKCGQEEPIPFAECYSQTTLQKCRKIGEGVYGEVFLYKNTEGNGTVMKIIPIEGSQLVNDEPQKKFSEILSEIVIAMELSKFSGFSKVKCVKCVQGRYPERLLDLWDLYDEIHKSENDSPELFGDDQLYIILELENGGMDMESFLFKNAEEAYSLFKQISYALAVAEQELEFEHRDLHWGNILIFRCDKNKLIRYCLNGREFSIPSNGIEVSIIDFTLSRVKIDTAIIYNDISKDPDLFSASGEYQFEIYKLMQKKNSNEWEHFEAYTNVLWMHYVVHKMITALRYSHTSSKIHKTGMDKLVKLEKDILKYNSVYDLVNNEFVF